MRAWRFEWTGPSSQSGNVEGEVVDGEGRKMDGEEEERRAG